MRRIKTWIGRILSFAGIKPLELVGNIRAMGAMLREYFVLRRQMKTSNSPFQMGAWYLCGADRYKQAGTAVGHYFWQDLFVAQQIFVRCPNRHLDVGSRLDGFVAHVASFREIEVLDIRPLKEKIPNVISEQADLMKLRADLVNCCDSLSCLHVIEHFGLGRYGDPIDCNGHLKGIDNLHKILAPEGMLYLSTPIGRQRIDFNAHRVFALQYLLDIIEPKFRIVRFSFVDDAGHLHTGVPLTWEVVSTNAGCEFGCGIFELVKLSTGNDHASH